jgi:hypothetical protein
MVTSQFLPPLGVCCTAMSDPEALCSRGADIAAEFPRGHHVAVDPEADIGTVMTSYWNVALPRAAGILARSLMTWRRDG